MAEQAPFFLFTAFVFAYGTEVLHFHRNFLLMAVLAAAVISFFSIPFFGHLSDRVGRKRVYMLGAVLTGGLRLCILRASRYQSPTACVARHRALACTA
jgi:MFS family permease